MHINLIRKTVLAFYTLPLLSFMLPDILLGDVAIKVTTVATGGSNTNATNTPCYEFSELALNSVKDINNNSVVLGSYYSEVNGEEFGGPALEEDGNITLIPNSPSGSNVQANSINNSDSVSVRSSNWPSGGVGFVFNSSTDPQYGELPLPEGWNYQPYAGFYEVVKINNLGKVLSLGSTTDWYGEYVHHIILSSRNPDGSYSSTDLTPNINYPTTISVRDMNDNGLIIGDRNGEASYFDITTGSFIPLPRLGPNTSYQSYASAVNNSSWIVGYSYNSNWQKRPVLWRNGQVIDLGSLEGGEGEANDINSNGVVIGNASTAETDPYGSPINKGFVWKNGVIKDLNSLLCSPVNQNLQAVAINDRGEIVGQIQGYFGTNTTTFKLVPRVTNDQGTNYALKEYESSPKCCNK